MDDMGTFERRLTDGFKGLMGPSEPVDDAAIFAAISTTRSRKWRAQSMFGATRFVVAAAIVVLFGGFAIAGVLTVRRDDPLPAVGATTTPESTTLPPIQLPTDIPADVRSGTLETPFGPARWVHLTGDEASLPGEFYRVLSTQNGYVVADHDPQSGTSKGLWRSPDLIRWTLEEPLGIQAGVDEIWRRSDTYWLSTGGGRDGPVSLWRSRDTEAWEQVSLEGLSPPGPDGFAWQVVGLSSMVTYDGTTIVRFEWEPDHWVVLRELPGIDELTFPALVETAPGVFDVREIESFPGGNLSDESFMTLRMEETERGLRVTDAADGTELALIDGVSLEFVELIAVEEGGPMGDYATDPVVGLAILDGEELRAVELPQEVAGYSPARWATLAITADEDGFVSYTIGPDGLVHVHRSQDGREWSPTDVIGDDEGEPTGVEGVWAWLGDEPTLSVVLSTATGEWRGSNGRLEPAPAPPGGEGFRVATGWIEGPGSQAQDRIGFIPDEGAPVSIDLSELSIPFGDCGAGERLMSPNTLVTVFYGGCREPRQAWILTFDDLPASGSTTQ